jgi:hypothetical protein
MYPTVPSETENFMKVSREHPGLSNDRELSFPLKIFACHGQGPRRYDLIVMRAAPGKTLAMVLHSKWGQRNIPDIMKIMRLVGQSLKRFHMRYHNQVHQDFQPGNVMWDDATQHVTIIDLGGMGMPTVMPDGEYFKNAFRQMTEQWGPTPIRDDGCRMFDTGYNECR